MISTRSERRARPAARVASTRVVNVVCAADDRYAMPLAVTLKSACRALAPGARIRAHVLTDSISDASWRKMETTLAGQPIDLTATAPRHEVLAQLPISHHISHAAYYRLLAAELLPSGIDKAIYLDSDLLVRRSLTELWDRPLGDQYCLAAVDLACPHLDARLGCANYRRACPYLAAIRPVPNYRDLGLDGTAEYFNSGVMVLNLSRWRRDDVATTLLKTLHDNRKHAWCWDQYALNVVFHGQWGRLEPRWNQGAHVFEFPSEAHAPVDPAEFRDAKTDPAIVHFTTEFKPWEARSNHPRSEVFFEGLADTAWRGWRPEPRPLGLRDHFDRQVLRLIKQTTISSRKVAVGFGW